MCGVGTELRLNGDTRHNMVGMNPTLRTVESPSVPRGASGRVNQQFCETFWNVARLTTGTGRDGSGCVLGRPGAATSKLEAPVRGLFLASLVILTMTSGIAAQDGKHVAAEGVRADAPRLDPALGAIRVSSDWQQTVFVLATERERTVVETPAPNSIPYGRDVDWKPPAGYGPVGFWTELKPGRYELIAASPGRQLAQATVEVTAGSEVWLNVKLEAAQSRIRISEPLVKVGPTWSKQELSKLDVKYRE